MCGCIFSTRNVAMPSRRAIRRPILFMMISSSCAAGFSRPSPRRAEQARSAGWTCWWSMKRITWNGPRPRQPGIRAGRKPGPPVGRALLLTATPEQLGPESHFARLRLLDPDRYVDFAAFQHDAGKYQVVAAMVEKLQAGKSPPKRMPTRSKSFFPEKPTALPRPSPPWAKARTPRASN